MPQLKDAISSFTISPELQHQESYSTTILRWMQDHPEQCRNTNFARMARTMALGRVTGQKEKNILMSLQNLQSRGLIDYNGAPRGRRKTVFINYLHKNIPKEIIERAPQDVIKQHEDLVGRKIIGVRFPVEQENEKKANEEVNKIMPTETPPSTQQAVENIPVPPVPTMDVPIELEKMPNGNFTLQLNINFTINSKK